MRYLSIVVVIAITAIIGCSTAKEEKGPMEKTGAYIDKSVGKGVEVTKDFFSDSAITARVKERLVRDEHVSGFDIMITTRKGLVIVEGDVDSETVAERTMDIVRATKGVRKAENHINIAAKSK